jgi:hypothetical protein
MFGFVLPKRANVLWPSPRRGLSLLEAYVGAAGRAHNRPLLVHWRHGLTQAASSKQQAASSKQQAASSKQQ